MAARQDQNTTVSAPSSQQVQHAQAWAGGEFCRKRVSAPVAPVNRTSSALKPCPMAGTWVWPRAAGCPVIGGSGAARPPPNFAASGCPVVGANPANQMPPSANEPLPGQSKPLSTWRQHSSIPTSAGTADALPQHQQNTAGEVGCVGSCRKAALTIHARERWELDGKPACFVRRLSLAEHGWAEAHQLPPSLAGQLPSPSSSCWPCADMGVPF